MIISPKWDYCMKELFRNPVIRKYFISVVLNIPVEMIRSTRLLIHTCGEDIVTRNRGSWMFW